MWQLDKEREKYSLEASDATSKYMSALEEVKLREMAIIDLQKKIVEAEGRLKQQQNLYEAVRSDRNLYSKNLIEAQDEIGDMKRMRREGRSYGEIAKVLDRSRNAVIGKSKRLEGAYRGA